MVTIHGYSSCNPPAYSGVIGTPVFSAEDTSEPVTLLEAKQYLRIDASEVAFDAEVTELISAARQDIEAYLNRSLIDRTVIATLNIAGTAILPYGPVKEITAVEDIDGNAVADYQLKGDVLKASGYDQLTLNYAAGYAALPATFKLGIKKLVAFDYQHKGDESIARKIGAITGLAKYRRVI
jgi:hypothetical protein